MNSMTGFGRAECQQDGWKVSVELSGVNRKQTEIALSLPRGFSSLETGVRQRLTQAISRGRVNAQISITRDKGLESVGVLNEELVRSYGEMFARISELVGRPLSESAQDYLRLPDVLLSEASSPELEPELCTSLLERALEEALEGFLEMRGQEGLALKEDILTRLAFLEERREQILEQAPLVVARYRELLLKRLQESGLSLDWSDERLLKEVGIFAERCDIAEEGTRLKSHFELFRQKCESAEPVGRPLDFLCQEINREFNTVASKANDSVLAHCVVEAKTELEKIREQIQNIE